MTTLQATALEKEIDKQIEEKENEFMKEILRGCEDTDSTEVLCAKMIRNAIGISIKLSVGTTLDMLINFGIVEPHDEEQLRKNIISVVK
ncbi:MAG: hypothetical protein K2K21_03555 [Lachnospiraceae bacterium]|nr:hypothetical protein [Lachnospiraceae bacterium]